jgi:hypothetical protein
MREWRGKESGYHTGILYNDRYTVLVTASERRRGDMSEADPKLEHLNHRLMNC